MSEAAKFADMVDLAAFVRDYPAVAAALGSSRAMPDREGLDFLSKVISADLPTGNVGSANLLFIAAVAHATGARRALEIGTASGTSSALLAGLIALNRRVAGDTSAASLVETIDRKQFCLFDGSKPIGFMVRELTPDLAARVNIHTEGDSFLTPRLFPAASLDLAFIDGNHQHPWPLLDVLNVLPAMRPGGWIIMHDIDLPAVAERLGIPARFGAQWLFDEWPLRKLAAGNIGAIATPDTIGEVRAILESLATRPYEVAETGWNRYRRMVAGAFAATYPGASEVA